MEDEILELRRKALERDYHQQTVAAASQFNWGAPFDLQQGALQWAWRNGQRTDERELEAAICDALQMGGILAHPGDGVSCAAQIVTYWKHRAEKAEATISEALARGLSTNPPSPEGA